MAASLFSSLSFQRRNASKASSFSSFRGNPDYRPHSSLEHLPKGCLHFQIVRCQPKCLLKVSWRSYRQKNYFGGLQHFPTKDLLRLRYTWNDDCGSPENSKKSMILDTSITGADALDNFGKELQTLFIEVRTMLEKGNKDDVVYLLQANYEVVKDQIDGGAEGIEQAAILDIVALGYVGVGDFKLVEHLLELLTEIMSCVSDNTPLVDSILIHMGSMYTTLGKLEEARCVYDRSLRIMEHLFGRQSSFLVIPLLGIAKVYKLSGNVTNAIENYHQAVDILERSRGVESEDLVLPLFNLGDLFISAGRATDAELSFRRIVTVYSKLYGEDDGRVGMAMCSLAHAMCAKGDLGEAVDIYKKGLQVIEDSKYLGLDDSILEKMRIELAELLHIAGREQEGRELLEECLLITERYKGGRDPSLVPHLINLASSYSCSKNYVEAERLLRMSLPIASKALDPGDPSITVPMLHLAVILYYRRRDEEAERLAREALCLREDAYGKQSLPVGEALDCLVSIKTRMGKDDGEILSLLRWLLNIQEKELGYESEEVTMTLKKVIFFLDKMGKRDEKLLLQRRLSVLRAKHRQKVAT